MTIQVNEQQTSSFNLQKSLQLLQQSQKQGLSAVNDVLTAVNNQMKEQDMAYISETLKQNGKTLLPFMVVLKELLLTPDQTFEESILAICEIVSKIAQAVPEQAFTILNDHILEPLVLNTAHSKSSVRKVSRSCIANYVRQFKDLRPILRTFTEFGILRNNNAYSKQCVILILPNLLNLDTSVINPDCTEILELTKALISQLDLNEEELTKSVNKVIGEMLKRFNSFEKIHHKLVEEHRKNKNSREESKTTSPNKLNNTVKQKPKEFVFGFIEQPIYVKMVQSTNLQDKTKAFEEALCLLQNNKTQQIRYQDLINFLINFLSESNQSQYATINAFALKMINHALNSPEGQQISKQSNITKLTTILTTKLIDNNKLVRQEAHQYFSQCLQLLGIKQYGQMITSILDNYCNSSSMNQQQISIIDSLLNIILSCVQKAKGKQDIDIKTLVQTISLVLDVDNKQQSKIIEIFYILQSSIEQNELMNEVRALFNTQFVHKLEERLGIARESHRRNLSISSSTVIQQDHDNSATKKKSLMLPNINHLAGSQPKPFVQANKSQSTNQKKAHQEYFQSVIQEDSQNAKIKPFKGKRYDIQKTDTQPTSPFTTTTMSSLSDKLHLIKKKETSEISDQSSQNNSNYGTFSVNSGLSRQRYNSQSHQVLPQVEKIQKNAILSKEHTKTVIVAPKSLSKNRDSSSTAQFKQSGIGKLSLDPSFFQQTNGSLSNSITDQFSTKISNKPGSGFTTKSMRFMRGTATSLGECSNNGENKYLSVNELEPLVNIDLEWKLCLSEIKSDNWSRQFEACNTLRKVFKYHMKEIVYEGKAAQSLSRSTIETFHEINQSLIKQADSLRSSVAKQAMITIQEMYEVLPKQLFEQDIEGMFTVIIKKSIDSNVFMAEEAEKTLISMCRNLPEGKMSNYLMIHKSNKNSIMRTQVCRALSVIMIRIKQNQKGKKILKPSETEKQIMGQLGTYMTDAAQEVRNQAKTSIKQIVNLFDEQVKLFNAAQIFQPQSALGSPLSVNE